MDGTLYPEEELPPNARELKGFNWRGEERLNSVEDLFAGEPPYELVKIQGIPLPDKEEQFFEERVEDDLLLNEKSRLRPEDLQNRAQDTISPEQADDTVQEIQTVPQRDSLVRPRQLMEIRARDSINSPRPKKSPAPGKT